MPFDVPTPFAWDASFDVKDDDFNTEHKKLFDLINSLDAARGDAAVLKELLDYVVFHFKHEEEKFAAAKYAAADSHKAIHDKFVQDALALTSVGDGEMAFIKQWLVDHIKGSDMKYAGNL